jgi:hypothetical protein
VTVKATLPLALKNVAGSFLTRKATPKVVVVHPPRTVKPRWESISRTALANGQVAGRTVTSPPKPRLLSSTGF